MSERNTPETDALRELFENYEHRANMGDVWEHCEALERQRNEARITSNYWQGRCMMTASYESDYNHLARELRDALEACREDSIELLGEWHWRKNCGYERLENTITEVESHVKNADDALEKAKQLLL